MKSPRVSSRTFSHSPPTQAAARGRAAVAKALVRDVEAAAKSLPAPKSPSTPARESLPSPALLLVVHGRALIYMYNCAFPARRSSERVAPRLRPGRALVVRTRLRGALLSLISTQAAARGRAAVAKALVPHVEAAARSLPTPSSPSTPSAGMFTFAGPSSSGARSRPYIYVQLRSRHAVRRNSCPHTAAL